MSRLELERCRLVKDLFIRDRFEVELAAFSFFASASSTGRGILESHGMSGEGGAMPGEGPDIMPWATLWMSLSHLSHRLRLMGGAFSMSGESIGLPGGRAGLAPRGSIIAEVETDFVSHLSPTLTSLVGGGASVMVALVFWFMYWAMLSEEDFLEPPIEFEEDLRDRLGEVDLRMEAMERWEGRWRGSGRSIGSNTMSATRGDSVS